MDTSRIKGIQNRQRIVEAADRLFYEQGYNATSFSDIAQVAEIPRGNFYYYFKTKDEILENVIHCRMDGVAGMLEGLESRLDCPRARLLALTDIIAGRGDDITRYGCRFGTLNAELGKRQQALQQKAAGMFDVFSDWMERQFRGMGFTDEARMLAMHLLACIQGTTLLVYTYKDKDFLRYEVARMRQWIGSLNPGETTP